MKSVAHLKSEDEWEQGLLLNDEWANYLTHGLGFILSMVGMITLLISPIQNGDLLKMINLGIFGFSLVLLYAASTAYHFVKNPLMKQRLRTLDHCAIYLLIAGSYTPFTMLVLGGTWGWTLFSIVWGLAFLGIISKIYFGHRFKLLSTSIYLFMGWLAIIAAEPFIRLFHIEGIFLIAAGGLSYTGGVIFFVMDHRRFFHSIWHLFVMGGSACHYFAVLLYI